MNINDDDFLKLSVKEYFEKYGAPSDTAINQLFMDINITPDIYVYIQAIKDIDKKALGRYFGKKSGYKFIETSEEKELSETAGKLYNTIINKIKSLSR